MRSDTHIRPTHPSSSSPACPLSCMPGIFRYRSPHYSSIQPRQTHKQISRLRRSQSLSALSESCTPVRYEPGAELNAARRHLTIPDPPKIPTLRLSAVSQPPIIQLKVICTTCSFSRSVKGGFLSARRERGRERERAHRQPQKFR